MKTITEFAAATLKNAAKTHQELAAAGKTAEEMPAAMGEALKLEGDKLGFLMAALEVIGTKTNDLKRVIVFSLNEGEKAPNGAQQKGDHYFAVEYFPPIQKGAPQKGRDDHRGGKRGDRDKKGGKRRGRGGRRDGQGGQGEKREAKAGQRPPRGDGKPLQIKPKGPAPAST